MPATEEKPAGAPVWIELGAHRPDEQAAFYRTALGLTALPAAAEFGGYRMLAAHGEPVAGLMGVRPADPSGWFVYLRCDDLDGTVADLEEHGGAIALAPADVGELGRMAWITDPSGSTVGLWQAGSFAGGAVEHEPGAPAWWELHVQERFAETVAFYERLLGWTGVERVDQDGFTMATYGGAGDAWAGIFDAGAAGATSSGWQVYFATDDADAAASRIASGGGTLLGEPADTPYGRFFEALDPEGSRFSVMQSAERPA